MHLYAKAALSARRVDCVGVPGVAAIARVRGVDVAFVAVHFANGREAEAKRLKHLGRASDVASKCSANVVLFGDMNLPDAELAKVLREPLRARCLKDAGYFQFSWDPRRNRYSDEEGYATRPPVRFDRVLYSGNLFGCSYLVGRRKQFQQGSGFYLSDHFAVLALLDVDAEHGRADRNLQLEKQRRAALARLRDQAALAEHQGDVEALRVGSEEAGLIRQRATEDVQAEVDAKLRSERAVAQKRFDRVRGEAFGKASLFAEGVSCAAGGQVPAAPATVDVAGLRGLPGGDASRVWDFLRGQAGDAAVPAIGGLKPCAVAASLDVVVRCCCACLLASCG